MPPIWLIQYICFPCPWKAHFLLLIEDSPLRPSVTFLFWSWDELIPCLRTEQQQQQKTWPERPCMSVVAAADFLSWLRCCEGPRSDNRLPSLRWGRCYVIYCCASNTHTHTHTPIDYSPGALTQLTVESSVFWDGKTYSLCLKYKDFQIDFAPSLWLSFNDMTVRREANWWNAFGASDWSDKKKLFGGKKNPPSRQMLWVTAW